MQRTVDHKLNRVLRIDCILAEDRYYTEKVLTSVTVILGIYIVGQIVEVATRNCSLS